MDALLISLSNVAGQLLPIIGAVALIFLCILLRKLWTLIDEATKTVKNLEPTLKGVEQSVEKIQAPLDTAVKLTKQFDDVQEKTTEGLTKATEIANENANKAKTFFMDQYEKLKKILNESKAKQAEEKDPFARKEREFREEIKKAAEEEKEHE